MHTRRLKRLKKAVDTRDRKLEAIANTLTDLQQVMVNHGTQLHALYKGRRAEVAALVTSNSKDEGGAAGEPKQHGGSSRRMLSLSKGVVDLTRLE